MKSGASSNGIEGIVDSYGTVFAETKRRRNADMKNH